MVPNGDLEDDDDLEMKVDVGEGEDELATMATSNQGTKNVLISLISRILLHQLYTPFWSTLLEAENFIS
jgi:hypothetical protein